MTDLNTRLPHCEGSTDLSASRASIADGLAMPKRKVYISAAEYAKLMQNNNKSYKSNAQAASQGADAGGVGQPASGRISNTLPSQKSRTNPAQFQGGVASLRNGGPDMADAPRPNGAHEGHNRVGNGHQQGWTFPNHSSVRRLDKGAEDTPCAIGKTNGRPRYPVRAWSGNDAAFGSELVQDHLHLCQYAGLHLAFGSPHVYHHRRSKPFKGKRIAERCAGTGGTPRSQHDRAIHSGGSHNPAATGQSHLTLHSATLQRA